MFRIIYYILIAVFLLSSQTSVAGDAGRESPFSIGVGARSLGMGGGFTSLADDASAVYYNPAGLANFEFQEFSLMYMDLFEGTNYNFAGWVYPDKKFGSLGFGYFRIGTDDIVRRNNFIDNGNFDYSTSQFLISYGKKLQEKFSFGFNLKIVNQTLDNLSDYSTGFDFGLLGEIDKHITAGIIIRDFIPPELKLGSSSETTPVTIAGGMGINNYPLAEGINLIASIELEKIEDRSIKLHTGGELLFNNNYALRAGYDRNNIAFGAGLIYHRIKFDYSYKILSYLEDSHRFSVSFLVGSSIYDKKIKTDILSEQQKKVLLKEERYRQLDLYKQKGDRNYSQQQYDSALVYYNRALAFDDGNKEIIETISEIENALKIKLEDKQEIYSSLTETDMLIENNLAQAQKFFVKKYYKAALDILQLIIKIDNHHKEANQLQKAIQGTINREIAQEFEKAKKSERNGNFLDALESYNHILELEPSNDKAIQARRKAVTHLDIAQHLNKGINLYNSGKFSNAAIAFKTILSIDKKNQAALEYLRNISLLEAEPATLDELQKNKVIWQLYLDGLKLMRNKEYLKAIDAWQKVLEVYPNNLNTLNNIEQARLRLKSEL